MNSFGILDKKQRPMIFLMIGALSNFTVRPIILQSPPASS